MELKLTLLLSSLTLIQAQMNQVLYFPDAMEKLSVPVQALPESQYAAPQASPPLLPVRTVPVNPVNISAIRGSASYENAVDRIISTGLLKTTLAINKVILETSRNQVDNIVFAPISITGALALVLLGSNGKTFEEISLIMGLATGIENMSQKSQIVHEQLGRMIRKLENKSGITVGKQVNFAAAIFVQENFPIRTLYKQTAEALYESEILNLDFSRNPELAQKNINAWVSDRTNGKITDIIANALPQSTKVVIVTAMHFKAEWEKPFFEGTTKRRPFYVNGRQSKPDIEVEMMSNGGYFPYYKDYILNCEILGFPYKGNESTMYVVMPFDSNKDVLKDLELKMTPEHLNRLVESTVYTGAVLLFPKMRIESTIDLKQTLETMGVKSLFNPRDANLALLSPGTSATLLPEPLANEKVVNVPINSVVSNPIAVNRQSDNDNDNDILIFSRLGVPKNCSQVFNPNSSVNICRDTTDISEPINKVHGKIGRRVLEKVETLDTVRNLINEQSHDNHFQNPGLYADKVIHKVYMDITESGTEAAASTAISLTRDGSRVTFRVDVPFFFFIRHEETKTILFWGSVNSPTPHFKV